MSRPNLHAFLPAIFGRIENSTSGLDYKAHMENHQVNVPSVLTITPFVRKQAFVRWHFLFAVAIIRLQSQPDSRSELTAWRSQSSSVLYTIASSLLPLNGRTPHWSTDKADDRGKYDVLIGEKKGVMLSSRHCIPLLLSQSVVGQLE